MCCSTYFLVHRLRTTEDSLDICRLVIHGQPNVFHPFAVKSKNDISRRLLLMDLRACVLYLTEISEEWTSMRILRNIKAEGIRCPVSCYPYSQDTLIANDVDQQSPAVHFVAIEEEEARKIFSFQNNHFRFKFPFDICESNGSVFVTDNERHCVFNLGVEARSMVPVMSVYDDAGEEDGPIEIAKLSHPSGIAVRGSVIYIAEHPREYQGAVRVMYSFEGLVSFQTIWRRIAYSMGLISKRSIANDTELANTVKTRKLRESHDELQAPAEQLKCLIESTVERTGAESLDITHGSMGSCTAQAVYHTLVEGQKFLLQYFDHIKHSELLNHILAKLLNDSLAEAFFGHIAEQVSSNNLTFIQMARLIPKEAFHYLLVVLTSAENSGVSVRRTRDEKPGKYFYSKIDDNDQSDKSHLLWMFFHARHDSLCTTDTLRRAKLNPGNELPNMSYIGDLNSCESFLDRIPIDKPNNEEANALRVVHVALKTRKMKSLRDFQKRRYGTASTVIGQHGTRIRTAIPEISGLFLRQQEQEGQDYPEENVDVNNRDDNNGILFEIGEVVVFRGTDGLDFNLLKITKKCEIWCDSSNKN